MTFLPIVARELRVASRRPGTYWVRAIVVALMIVGCAWLFLIMHRDAPKERAMVLFGVVTGGALLFAVLSGIRATADCLSVEKREGTLGLLFLTPLKGYDVVLGKFAASSLSTLYGVCAVLPLLGLPLLMGGVAVGEFVRMALLLVNGMLFSLAAGIFVSSIGRDARRTRVATLGLLLLLMAGLPALGAFLEHESRIRDLAVWFLLPSPWFTFYAAWDVFYSRNPQHFWLSMAVIHLLTHGFFILACWFAPRTWKDRPRARTIQSLPGQLGTDSRVAADSFRRRLLNRNAFYWLTARPRWKPALVWGTLAVAAVLWIGLLAKYPSVMKEGPTFVMVAILLNGIMKVWVASEASRRLAEDRRSGSIELLLSTPITVQEIIGGQWRALLRQFGFPVGTILLAETIMMLVGLHDFHSTMDRRIWVTIWLCGMTFVVADLITLFLVGMWLSLVAKGPAEATGGALFRVLALPWILWLGMAGVIALGDTLDVMPDPPNPEWVFWLGTWFGIGVVVNVVLITWAWMKLHGQFRRAAAVQYDRRVGFWRRILGRAASGSG